MDISKTQLALTALLFFGAGRAAEEVTLPGVGTISKEGDRVRAAVEKAVYLREADELMIGHHELGFISRNSSGGRQACLAGTILASHGPNEMQFTALSRGRSGPFSKDSKLDIERAIMPAVGSTVISGSTTRAEGQEITELDIEWCKDSNGTLTTIASVLLGGEANGLAMVTLTGDNQYLVLSREQLVRRETELKGFYAYGRPLGK